MSQEIKDEVNIEIYENSDISYDSERKELLWQPREERIIDKWKTHCVNQSELHGVKARLVKRRYQLLTIPSILIPVCLSGFSSLLENRPLIVSGCMVCVSILTGVNGFLNLGSRTSDHFNSEGRYADLSMLIESEMCKPKSKRLACDVYLEKIRSNISKLDLSSPNL